MSLRIASSFPPADGGSSATRSAASQLRSGVLDGARVLIVEDEFMVAALLEDTLQAFGCEVVGPAARIDEALALLEREEIDAAVLDVNIAGEQVFPVADVLERRGIPFVFATAYGRGGVAEAHRTHEILQKPYELRSLRRALESSLYGRR